MKALQELKRSPLALDIYCWLTHRMSYLRKDTVIPWPLLQLQFGVGYAEVGQGPRDFKTNFRKQLRKVHVIYPQAKVTEVEQGLFLKPSPPSPSCRNRWAHGRVGGTRRRSSGRMTLQQCWRRDYSNLSRSVSIWRLTRKLSAPRRVGMCTRLSMNGGTGSPKRANRRKTRMLRSSVSAAGKHNKKRPDGY